MELKIIVALAAFFQISLSSAILPEKHQDDCFIHGLQSAGLTVNDPLQDKAPSAEACQLFCQTVFDCVDFSWADATYSWTEYQNSCWLFSEVKVDMVDEHFVSGPKYC